MKTKLTLIFIIVFLLKTTCSFSNVITALSCSQVDVQSAINIALDGDTVVVPTGTVTWTQTVMVDLNTTNRALTIRGSGNGQTVIYDGVSRVPNTLWHVLKIITSPTKPFRLTGFTFKTSPTVSIINYDGLIKIAGTTKSFRIDHNEFLQGTASSRAIFTDGWLYGVIDHNTFISPTQAVTIWHSSWGGKSWGDGSWADSLTLGSDRAIFIEDNYMRRTAVGGMVDSWMGGRYVVRNNKIIDTHVDNHGTETSGRLRGIFSWEIYNNDFSLLNHSYEGTAINIRGGTGVAYNNTLSYNTASSNIGWNDLIILNNYRSSESFNPFGVADGSSPWDKNYVTANGNSIVFDSGAHTAVTNTIGVLIDATKTWSINQWVGYSLRNVTKNWGCHITANSATSISVAPSYFNNNRLWQPGDVFQILKVEATLDQVGRSTGDLIYGGQYTPPPFPAKWPNQKLEPVYIWGNSKNNNSFNKTSATAFVIKKNSEYYEGAQRPGYIPYTYPHPLTLCGYTADSSKVPTLNGFAMSSSVVCQGQTNVVFGVSANASATFSWNYTGTGVTITNTSNIVSLNFSSSATSGTLSVFASSACGSSSVLSIPVTVNAMVANAGTIGGLTTVVPGQTNVTYTVAPIANATSYIWTLPSGATGTSTTNSITINYGSSAISDNLIVQGNNGCGTGASSTLAITVVGTPLPSNAGIISGTNSVCPGQTVTYSISAIPNAVSYIWTLPVGATGSSSTNIISVKHSTVSGSDTITVKGYNGSGNGVSSNLVFTINPLPANASTIIGASPFCIGQSQTYTIAPIANASSYIWTYSGYGNTGTSTTNSISIMFNYSTPNTNVASYITVQGLNSCGTGSTSNKTVVLKPLPILYVFASSDTICSGQTTNLTSYGATTYTWSTGGTGTNVAVAPISATNYTVTGTLNGCVASKTLDIKVNPTPTLSVNNATICPGGTATLTANGAATYLWNTNATTSAIIDSPPVNTIYTVMGDLLGCIDIQTVSITIGAGLSLNPVASSTAICSGGSSTLSVSGANTYTWNTGSNATSIVVSPTTNTIYNVIGSSGSCMGTGTVGVNITPGTVLNVAASSAAVCMGSSSTLSVSGAATYTWNNGSTASFINVSPTVTTTYTVMGNNGPCAGSNTIALMISPVPTVTAVSPVSGICNGQSAVLTAGGATSYTWSNGATTSTTNVSPIVATIYTVTGNTGICSNSNTVSIMVNATPSISVNSSTICSGQSFTMIPSGASTYTFSSGSSVVTPSVNTTYTVTGTDALGCVNTIGSVANVTINASPIITVNGGSICSGQSFTMIPSGASTYTFSSGSAVVTPSVNTTYTVTGTDALGCVNNVGGVANVTISASPIITVNSGSLCSGQLFTMIPSGASTYTFSSGTAIVSPTANTSYTVMGTNAGGCVSSSVAISNVSVIAAPSLTVIGPYAMCLNQTISLSVSGSNTYTWSTGIINSSIVVSPTTNINYTVTSSNAQGCTGSTIKNITVNPIPTVLANTSAALICKGTSALLTASGVNTYSWNNGALTNTLSVTPTVSTIYSVIGWDTGTGCFNTATVNVQVSNCTDIVKLSGVEESAINVYPNPTNGVINYELGIMSGASEASAAGVQIQILNELGQIVMEEIATTHHSSLIIHHLVNGMYFVKIIRGGKAQTVKIIKE